MNLTRLAFFSHPTTRLNSFSSKVARYNAFIFCWKRKICDTCEEFESQVHSASNAAEDRVAERGVAWSRAEQSSAQQSAKLDLVAGRLEGVDLLVAEGSHVDRVHLVPAAGPRHERDSQHDGKCKVRKDVDAKG